MSSAGMATFIHSRLMHRTSNRSPGRFTNRRRSIRHSRFAVMSSAHLRHACSIRIQRRSESRGCTTTLRRTKFCFTCAAISGRVAGLNRLQLRCIRAGFRTGRIPGRSWRARTLREQKSWRLCSTRNIHSSSLSKLSRSTTKSIHRAGWIDQGRAISKSPSADWRPPLLETAPSPAKLIQCGTEIPKPKPSCKRLNVESARFNVAAPHGSRAWSNRFSACSKPLAKIRSAKGRLERRAAQSVDGIINHALFESEASEIILVKDIELYSLCEHHLIPFIGKAHVAYIPNGKVVGLSKTARIVDMFARRLQIQENLTMQIADALMKALHPRGVGVVIEAKHLCMMMRGVEKQNSAMKTSCLLGVFKEDARTRSEFLSLLKD